MDKVSSVQEEYFGPFPEDFDEPSFDTIDEEKAYFKATFSQGDYDAIFGDRQ